MSQNSSRSIGRHFLHIPGPTPLPDRVLRAMDTPIIDHRGPEFAKLAKRVSRRHQDHLQDHQSGHHLHRDRHRRLGSGAGQHAVARRPRADGRDRPVRHAVEEDGREARPQAGIHHDRLAHRRRPEGDRGASARGQGPRDQGGLRRCTTRPRPARSRRSPRSARRSTPPAIRRCCMVDTISSLASTDYRHDEWGVDVTVGGAQKGLMLPPGMSFNAVSDKALAACEDLEAAEVVLGLGGHAQHEQDRLLPLHAGDPHAARPRGRHRHAARGRTRQRVRPP